MGTELMLDVGQANEIKLAAVRAGATNTDLKRLSEGDMFTRILPVLRGLGEVTITKYIVDLDADPMVYRDWKVEEHIKGGQFEFDQVKVGLHLDEEQKEGGVIIANKLREKLKGQPVYNANLLDFYLAHPNLIPDEWKGKVIVFWGTIYRNSRDRLLVRCLFCLNDKWSWIYRQLDCDRFGTPAPAAVAVRRRRPGRGSRK
ncbi:MAG: hypothetical protein HUU49_00330 [Candidatus Buchananbacteria bacterium]|nr:hypothetical protein [Candidatus Buchananbacteria bacterium]